MCRTMTVTHAKMIETDKRCRNNTFDSEADVSATIVRAAKVFDLKRVATGQSGLQHMDAMTSSVHRVTSNLPYRDKNL